MNIIAGVNIFIVCGFIVHFLGGCGVNSWVHVDFSILLKKSHDDVKVDEINSYLNVCILDNEQIHIDIMINS